MFPKFLPLSPRWNPYLKENKENKTLNFLTFSQNLRSHLWVNFNLQKVWIEEKKYLILESCSAWSYDYRTLGLKSIEFFRKELHYKYRSLLNFILFFVLDYAFFLFFLYLIWTFRIWYTLKALQTLLFKYSSMILMVFWLFFNSSLTSILHCPTHSCKLFFFFFFAKFSGNRKLHIMNDNLFNKLFLKKLGLMQIIT